MTTLCRLRSSLRARGGDLYLTADHERAHPVIDALLPADEIVEEFSDACRAHGLKPSLDVILERIDADAAIVRSRPDWFHAADTAARVDPRSSCQGADAAYARFDQRAIAKEIAGWLIERLLRLLRDLMRETSFTWRQVAAHASRSRHDSIRHLAPAPRAGG